MVGSLLMAGIPAILSTLCTSAIFGAEEEGNGKTICSRHGEKTAGEVVQMKADYESANCYGPGNYETKDLMI